MESKPLKNVRHEKFVLALVKGMTQTQAAIEAGYSQHTADVQASRLLTKVMTTERRE